MTVAGHGGNDAEEVSGAQGITPLLFHNFHFFGDPDFTLPYNEETVGILLAFNHNIGIFDKFYKCELKLIRHPVSFPLNLQYKKASEGLSMMQNRQLRFFNRPGKTHFNSSSKQTATLPHLPLAMSEYASPAFSRGKR
jgi:hypothetical protein